MDIGLFFGSFNPIHTGHLIIANHILNESHLKKIWLVVSPLNPFKTDTMLLNEQSRLTLVQIAVADDERIIPKDIEFHLPRPSFTVNTLAWLQENCVDEHFSIIMGSDSFQSLDKWKNFESITHHHKIFVYKRPGFEVVNTLHADIEILDAPLLDISSSTIRELIKKRKSIRYLVPETVRTKIEKNDYYIN
jgi:nicotinate-nucleotide adenylyltransferase